MGNSFDCSCRIVCGTGLYWTMLWWKLTAPNLMLIQRSLWDVIVSPNACYELSSWNWVVKLLSAKCQQNTQDDCSGNGLMPSRSKPLPEPTLTHWGRDKMAAILPDDIFKWIFFNENVWISINISLKVVPRGPINNIPTLVQVMDWRRPGDKPLSEPMMVRLPTHICVTRPQWVNPICPVIWRH